MHSTRLPSIEITLVGLRNPLTAPLAKDIVGGQDRFRTEEIDNVEDKSSPLYQDLVANRIHTESRGGRGGAYLSHGFAATLQAICPTTQYSLGSVGGVGRLTLTMKNGEFNQQPIIDLQEENPGNQGLNIRCDAQGSDGENSEKCKNLSWLPNLVLVKHHQFYMPKNNARMYQDSYMESILNSLYYYHCKHENRLYTNTVSYVGLLNVIAVGWNDPNFNSDLSACLQQGLDRSPLPSDVPFYSYEDKNYGSDYIVFPRSQTLILSPELLIHRPDIIEEIKATLFLQHQILLFILQKLRDLAPESPIPRGILIDLQLFEGEILQTKQINNIDDEVDRERLKAIASSVVDHLNQRKIDFFGYIENLGRNRPKVLFNHLKIVIQQDTHLIKEMMQYRTLEKEFIQPGKEHNDEFFNNFFQHYQAIIESPDSEITDLFSLINTAYRKQKQDIVIKNILFSMMNYIQEMSVSLYRRIEDVGGNDDIDQYIEMANIFDKFRALYVDMCLCNIIVQVPRWIQNIKLDTTSSVEWKQSINTLINNTLSQFTRDKHLRHMQVFSILVAKLQEIITIERQEFVALITYMADYLYAASGEKITYSIMSTFVKSCYNPSPPEALVSTDFRSLTLLAIEAFFLTKLSDPFSNHNLFDYLTGWIKSNDYGEIVKLLKFLLSGIYDNISKEEFTKQEVREFSEYCLYQIRPVKRDNGNLQESKEKITQAQNWAKEMMINLGDSSSIPAPLRIILVQSILLDYYKKTELETEGIYILAISYLKQNPRNIYMACQLLGELSNTIDEDLRGKVIEELDSLEDEGFLSQALTLQKFDEAGLAKTRAQVISKRLLHLSVVPTARGSIALPSPVRTSLTDSENKEPLAAYHTNIFSLTRISRNNGLEKIAFPVLEVLSKKTNDDQTLYSYIWENAATTFPRLYQELQNGANLWCLYAIVIAYLRLRRQDVTDVYRDQVNNIHPRIDNINGHWHDFLQAANISESFRALKQLHAAYNVLGENHAVSPAGQQAIDLLMNAIVPERFRQYSKQYQCLASMFDQLTEHTASPIMNFLIKNGQSPFIFHTQDVSCLIIYKERLGYFQYFSSFLGYVNDTPPPKNHSILVLLLATEKNKLFIKEINSVGKIDPDLFNFVWYLRYDEKQAELATALTPYVFEAKDLECFFKLLRKDRHSTNVLEGKKQQFFDMIKNEKGLLPILINRTEEHLRLAFIIDQHVNQWINVHKRYCFSDILREEPGALATLFFINELLSATTDQRSIFLMNFLILNVKPLKLSILLDSIRSFSFFNGIDEAIKTTIEHIVNEDANNQILSVISFFNQRKENDEDDGREYKNGYS